MLEDSSLLTTTTVGNSTAIHETSSMDISKSETSLAPASQNLAPYEIPDRYHPILFSVMKEVSKVYLASFEKANYIGTKKPKSMVQTVINLTKNETTKRSKAKRQTDLEI